MRIPSKYKIARKEIIVELVDNISDGSKYGDFNDAKGLIRIANRIKVEDEWITLKDCDKLNTFWHEVFHSFQYYWNNKCDEDFAQILANFMCEFLESSE